MRERGRREGKSGERIEGGEDGKRRDGGKGGCRGWKDEGRREERENVRKKGKRGDWRTQ